MSFNHLLFVVFAVVTVVAREHGPKRNCSYADYLVYNRANLNNYGVKSTYGEGYVDQEISGFALDTLVYTARPTYNSICAFDFSADFNGWSVEYLDDMHCAMRLSRRMTNDVFFGNCSEPRTDTGEDAWCAACAQYITTVVIKTSKLFTGTLPSGEPQYLFVQMTDTGILLVPTEASGSVSINVVAPASYGFLLTASIAVLPGTSTIGLTYKGQISYPYSIAWQVNPPVVMPQDQLSAAVLPLWVHDGYHTWSEVMGQILSQPKDDCKCNGKFTVNYQVLCLDESLCDMEVFTQNRIINATYDVVYNGCPEHSVEGTASLILGVNDTKTMEAVSIIMPEKPYDLVSRLVYTGPPPSAPMNCTYSLQQRHHDGTEGKSYTNIEVDPRFSPSFQLQTITENTLRFTMPVEMVEANGDVFVISEQCTLPRFSTKQAGATAAKGTFAFSFPAESHDSGDVESHTIIYAVVGACVGVIAIIVVVVVAVWWSRKKRGFARV